MTVWGGLSSCKIEKSHHALSEKFHFHCSCEDDITKLTRPDLKVIRTLDLI